MKVERRRPTITEPMSPTEIIESGYGTITGLEWCGREMARLRSKGDENARLWEHNGMIALTRRPK
jgi:hypothetical protein